MRGLTHNIGKANVVPKIDENDHLQINRVLIVRPNNRLGNLLLITPLVQEIAANFPNARIDLFTRGGLGTVIFQNYHNVDRIIQLPKKPFEHLLDYAAGWLAIKRHRYDLVVNVVKHSSSGRLSTQFARSGFKIFGDIDETITSKYDDHRHVAKYPVYNLRKYLSLAGLKPINRPVPVLDIRLSVEEINHGHDVLLDLVHNRKRTLCLFTYATGDKCYPPEWWEPFYDKLREQFPDDNIIEVLPAENVSQLSFKIPSFYSTDIREVASLIANTDVFIGADSGIMHLSSSVQTPTVGLFKVTDPATFGPYGSGSIAINTNETPLDSILETVDEILNTKRLSSTYRTRTRKCLLNRMKCD